jgi:hypothetical protein
MYTCTWSQDPETGDALLCVAGLPPSIKIFNVTTGELERVGSALLSESLGSWLIFTDLDWTWQGTWAVARVQSHCSDPAHAGNKRHCSIAT